MEKSKTDRRIRQIVKMEFGFPPPSIGYGVDKESGLGTPPEEFTDEEAVEVLLYFRNDPGIRVIKGEAAMTIYESVWKHFNDEETV